MTSEAVLRWLRALTLPSVLFTTALAGHAAGDGVIPAASVLVPLFVLTVIVVAQFAVAPTRPSAAVAMLLAGQGLLHAAFQLLGGTAVPATTVMCGMGTAVAGTDQLPPDDASRCHVAWFCDVADGRRAPGDAARALGGRDSGWGVAGLRGAGVLAGGATRCTTSRRRMADGHARGPQDSRRCGHQLSTASARLELAMCHPWLDLDGGCRLAARPARRFVA